MAIIEALIKKWPLTDPDSAFNIYRNQNKTEPITYVNLSEPLSALIANTNGTFVNTNDGRFMLKNLYFSVDEEMRWWTP